MPIPGNKFGVKGSGPAARAAQGVGTEQPEEQRKVPEADVKDLDAEASERGQLMQMVAGIQAQLEAQRAEMARRLEEQRVEMDRLKTESKSVSSTPSSVDAGPEPAAKTKRWEDASDDEESYPTVAQDSSDEEEPPKPNSKTKAA